MPGTQSEAQLEAELLRHLAKLGWGAPVDLPDEAALLANLRAQLGAHNGGLVLSDPEFALVLNHLGKGGVLSKAKTLRDRFRLSRDDGSHVWLEFFDSAEWCRNRFQVASQIGLTGRRKNRYDVTLLVNGLPLVQIELKRRGIELKAAFNQINRYQRDSFRAAYGLFQYVQIFAISNGVNTRVYANNRSQTYRQTFTWGDADNRPINRLQAFTDAVLEKCQLAKLIARYIVIHETDGVLMLLRSYQVAAAEAIAARVEQGRRHGYIWHATGSGKTLTSFKAAQNLIAIPKVAKVVFVVDRADLDYQTIEEFNRFQDGSVDATEDTRSLVRQMGDPDAKLVVTTIQKLNAALSRAAHAPAMDALRGERIVFIFDECHRSQFGEAHRRIREHFLRAQMFGFTGTPILAANAIGKRTTADLFDECLHRYVITDAIRDGNVLPFSVEYWGPAEGWTPDGPVGTEFHEGPEVVARKVDWILENHARKSRGGQFGAMMATGSVTGLLAVWDEFERRRVAGEHALKVAAIFTYAANEEDPDADGLLPEPDFPGDDVPAAQAPHRDRLVEIVRAYNTRYGTAEDVRDGTGFYRYYRALAKRVKARDRKGFSPDEGVDILLVVNMFLTGFDARTISTLYVDKNLRYHGLIQAFSRTNRTLGETKPHGNVVCFRDLMDETDKAIALFGDRQAAETVLVPDYAVQRRRYVEAAAALLALVPNPDAVDDLPDEEAQAVFVKAFREVLRMTNLVMAHSEFESADLAIDAQTFEDFKSKYLDLQAIGAKTEEDGGDGPLTEIDFELELLRQDEINVAYILTLIVTLKALLDGGERQARRARAVAGQLHALLREQMQLREKRSLIERFVAEVLPRIEPGEDVRSVFSSWWDGLRSAAYADLCASEGVDPERLDSLMSRMHFTGKPLSQGEIVGVLVVTPGIHDRDRRATEVRNRIDAIMETFELGVGDLDQTVQL